MKSRRPFILFAASLLAVGAAVAACIRCGAASLPMGAELPGQEKGNAVARNQEAVFARGPKPAGDDRQSQVQPAELERIDPARRIRLAVGWLGLPNEAQNRQIADLIVAQFSSEKNLELVDRQSLDAVLREGELSLSGLVRADGAIRVGKLLRADWFLMGSSAVVGGANSLVARIVDSRTGTMRDIALLPLQKEPARLAGELAQFVRQCRASASSAKPRLYVSIGDFDDMSLNSHQAAFGEQLRANLAAALRTNTKVTLLERDGLEALLQEMRLDLAGLTEEQTTNPEVQIQSAVWNVHGYYQSYENQAQDVELVLQVQPAFGQSQETNLRGAPGAELFHLAQQAVEKAVADVPSAVAVPSRSREIREAQKTMMSRCAIDQGTLLAFPLEWSHYSFYNWNEKGTPAQIRHHREEGLRATQTLLLLDPTNRLAMLYMAVYLQDPVIHRDEEARNYFKEVADNPVVDHLKIVAMCDLAETYARTDPKEAVRLIKLAREHFTAEDARLLDEQTERRMLELAGAGASSENDVASHAQDIVTRRLFTKLQGIEDDWIRWEGSFTYPDGMVNSYLETFGAKLYVGLATYAALLPELKAKFPALAPYLVESAFIRQTNSDNPFASDLERAADFCAEHPDKVMEPDFFFGYIGDRSFSWCMNHQQYALAARLIEAKSRELVTAAKIGPLVTASKPGPEGPSSAAKSNMIATLGVFLSTNPPVSAIAATFHTNSSATNAGTRMLSGHDKIRLARAYARMERWQDALDIIDSIPKRPVPTGPDFPPPAPWEPYTIPGYTNDAEALCREKLGLPPAADSKLLRLGDPCLPLHSPFAFATDAQGVWVAEGPALLRLDFNMVTNKTTRIPNWNGADDTAICLGPAQLWIGTDGNGLLEFDRATRKVLRRWTEKDGLYSDHITRLCLDKDVLWIGFGYQDKGAVGRLDLASGKLTASTPALRPEPLRNGPPVPPSSGAPGEAINGLALGMPGELYVSTPDQALRYRIQEDKWGSLPDIPSNVDPVSPKNSGLTFDGSHIFVNQTSWGVVYGVSGPLALVGGGLAFMSPPDGPWGHVGVPDGLPLPNSTATAVNGKDVWLGGRGYIGVVDLEKKALRKVGYMQANVVDHLEIAGGFLWAQFGGDLYRIPLSAAN